MALCHAAIQFSEHGLANELMDWIFVHKVAGQCQLQAAAMQNSSNEVRCLAHKHHPHTALCLTLHLLYFSTSYSARLST
jgi:hypothetical protein